jgi:ribonuclease H2 subunit A
MLRGGVTYNLNAQAHDATAELIHGVLVLGVTVVEIYVDTVGPPATYQAKLAK